MSAKAILSASVSAPPVFVEDVFSTFLYTGNGTTQTITNGIDLSGKGGLVWTKKRNLGGYNSFMIDSARNNDSYLIANSTLGEASAGPTFNVVFNSNGFTDNLSNQFWPGDTLCSWTFRKQPKFFDVVTYTGTGTTQAIPHNLGSAPGMYVCKSTSGTGDWNMYHRGLSGANKYLMLNSTAGEATSGSYWDSQAPTANVFYVGNNNAANTNGVTYVAYLFAHNAGGFGTAGTDNVVSCGSFTTDGSGNATVNLGYEPQWLLVKRTSATQNWFLVDNMRGLPVVSTGVAQLNPNTTDAESLGLGLTPTSTGFNVGISASSDYIYIAIRRGPMKTPTVGTEVFKAVTRAGTSTVDTITGLGFTPDSALIKNRLGNAATVDWSFNFFDKLRIPGYRLSTASVDAEDTIINFITSFNQAGITFSSVGYTATNGAYNYINYFFRRAPGFFDVVAYTGTGANRTVSHNLGVTPELMIAKVRSAANYWWAVYVEPLGAATPLLLNYDGILGTDSTYWNSAPTSSVFSVGANSRTNLNAGTLIAYLFASCPGVSKVGSYTGTGTTLQINCGFTAGARFVMIKRTDSTGDWYVWDTARGIISGNDPYLLINSTAAEVTGTDYIDPLSSGFEISSTAPAAINANGGSYIFLSIA